MFCRVGSEVFFGDSCGLAGQYFVYVDWLNSFLFPVIFGVGEGFFFHGSTNWLVYLVGDVKSVSLLVFWRL